MTASGRPSVPARWLAGQRARLGRTRPSTPTGDRDGERQLYRDVAGILGVPIGGGAGIAARTRAVDAQVALGIGRGIDQIILLGAGYDGRSLRFGGGSVRWFEVDRPATLADKQRRLGALGLEPTGVVFVGVDILCEDVGAALGAAGHDRDRPSLFVCESLLSRLSLEASAALCHALRAGAAPGSLLVADGRVAPDAGVPVRALRRTTDLLFAALGEPRGNEFRPGDPEKLMVVTGWRVTQMQSSAESRLDRGSHTVVLVCEPDAPRPL